MNINNRHIFPTPGGLGMPCGYGMHTGYHNHEQSKRNHQGLPARRGPFPIN